VEHRMNELFAAVLGDEPSLRLTVDGLCASGRRRVRQRNVVMVVGLSALVAGATATVVVASPAARGLPTPVGTGPPTVTAPPETRPAFEIPRCAGEASPPPLDVDDTDGSVLPDPDAAMDALLAAAPSVAPARAFGIITASRVDTSEKHPDGPRVHLIVNVSTGAGVGSMNLELIAQTGASPAARAEYALAVRPFSNCVHARRLNFPDGSVALAYTPFGDGDPDRTVLHVAYYAVDGLDVNVGVFMHEWPNRGETRTLRPTTEMPLTADEAIEFARVVAATR
jgi:hypothetical protein